MPEVVWKQGAENDLFEVFSNLEEHEQGSGERLVERLDFTLAHLRQHPEMAPIFEPPVRRLVIGSTGFGVFYSVESRGIIVHALVHLARDPRRSERKFAGC
jgi:plasmid stabilization system protein ParE